MVDSQARAVRSARPPRLRPVMETTDDGLSNNLGFLGYVCFNDNGSRHVCAVFLSTLVLVAAWVHKDRGRRASELERLRYFKTCIKRSVPSRQELFRRDGPQGLRTEPGCLCLRCTGAGFRCRQAPGGPPHLSPPPPPAPSSPVTGGDVNTGSSCLPSFGAPAQPNTYKEVPPLPPQQFFMILHPLSSNPEKKITSLW